MSSLFGHYIFANAAAQPFVGFGIPAEIGNNTGSVYHFDVDSVAMGLRDIRLLNTDAVAIGPVPPMLEGKPRPHNMGIIGWGEDNSGELYYMGNISLLTNTDNGNFGVVVKIKGASGMPPQ